MTQSILDLYLKEDETVEDLRVRKHRELFVDGYTIGKNPSKFGGGYCIMENDVILEEVEVKRMNFTNNEAELLGMTRALELADEGTVIYTDSQNTIAWVRSGRPKSRMDLLYMADRAKKMRRDKSVNIVWVPREENLAGIYLENKGL